MIKLETNTVKAEGDEIHALCAVQIKGKHSDVMREYISTVESLTRAILQDVPDALQSPIKQDMKLALMRMCLDVL